MSACPLQKVRMGCGTGWNCSCPLVRVSGAIGRSRSPPRWENWSWPRDCPVRWDCNVRLYLRAIRRVTNVPAAVAAAAIPRCVSRYDRHVYRSHPIRELSRSFDWGSVNSSNLYGCSFSAIIVAKHCREDDNVMAAQFRGYAQNYSAKLLHFLSFILESRSNVLHRAYRQWINFWCG